MSWSSRRRSLISGGTIFIVAAFLSVVAFVSWHETPSCMDGKRNQDEEGIDCGGSCALLCRETVAAPSVRFVRALSAGESRTDIIAYIDNPNPRAASRNATFTTELIDTTGTVIDTRTGMVDLPPATTIPVFMSGFSFPTNTIARAFISFDESTITWSTEQLQEDVPRVTDTNLTTSPLPRLSAKITNDLPYPLYNVRVVAAIFDTAGEAMAASETIVPRMAANTTETVVFTWNAAFPSEAGRIDVTPVVLLARP